jgi:signal transduction histidine kinase/CheY-like chemotaxis protein
MQVEATASAYDEGVRKMIQFNVRDNTERKRFERQLEQTQKLESLGLLAGGIAHDFHNLLTGIMINASVPLSELDKDDMTVPYLREILRASERASVLTRQMLDYAGRGRFVAEHTDLNELITDISVLVRSSLPKRVELTTALTPDSSYVDGDPGQIQQLIMNLLINAGEAIPEGRPGAVTLRTEVREFTADELHRYSEGLQLGSGKYCVIVITDNGAGMDETTKSRIFDPFFTTKFTGRGLGLAAALGIIKRHHGAIRVDSEIGRGTLFEVLFPASTSVPAKRQTLAAQQPVVTTGIVLVVDDEDTIRVGAKAGLERSGYQVIVAATGAEGIRIFRDRHQEISIVILDRTMPDMGGEEVLAQMQAIDTKVPVILSTGYSETETLARVSGPNLAGFLPKPYAIEKLLEEIQRVLSRTPGSRPGLTSGNGTT